MNDLEDRLSRLLTRVADDVVVRPDLDGVVEDRLAVVVERSGPSRRRRTALAFVAAALVVAAVVVVADRADQDHPVATAPSGPGAFPVLEGLPKGTDVQAELLPVGPPAQMARAVVGRRSGDRVTDLVWIYAYRERVTPGATLDGREPPGALGAGATRYVNGDVHILKVDGTGIVISGLAPEALFRATPITARWDDDLRVERLVLGDLPPGYQVLVPPGPPVQARRLASVMAHPEGELLSVEVGTDPVSALLGATASGVRAVTVADRAGWLVEGRDGAAVLWSPDGTHSVLLRSTLGADAALAAAARVHLVDEATWRQRYEVSEGGRGTETTQVP